MIDNSAIKLADAEFLFWLIVVFAVGIGQLFKKLQQAPDESDLENESEPAPRPRPPVKRNAPPVSAPKKQWRADRNSIEDYRRRLQQILQPIAQPPPVVEVVPPPVQVFPAAKRKPERSAPVTVVNPPPRRPRRNLSPLVAELRQPRNMRKYILASAILGRPRGM